MEPSNLAKIGAAFVGGVVVALGSALIYVKVNDVPPHPLVVPPIQAPAVATPPVQRAGESNAVPSPAAVTPPVQAVAHRQTKLSASSSPKHVSVRHAVPKLPTKLPKPAAVVEIARNTQVSAPIAIAPEPPRSVFVPTPAVNENEAPPGPQLDLQPAPIAPQQPQPHVVRLPEGTNLVIRLGETLSTEHNYSGDTFRGTLDVPIIMDGFIIADKGSKVLGRIAGAQKAGRMEGVANLHVTLTEINTTDGQRVPVETGFIDKKGRSNGGENAAKIAGGAALGAIIGALGGGGKGAAIGAGAGGAAGTGAVLLTHGRPAVLPAETRLTFQLTRPATISEKLN
ncbi:MAG TPA: hypothetical protein VGL97_10510 [Bryobacteraceae bacterium]